MDRFIPASSKEPVRFAVGSPEGVTSNSWRIWTQTSGDVYIACRDNFREIKVSLHASGRWRMGFTAEAVEHTPTLIQAEENRAWDVWDRPPQYLPNTVTALRILFPTSELYLNPTDRMCDGWSQVIYLASAPPGELLITTLFITLKGAKLIDDAKTSSTIANLDLGNEWCAQLIAHRVSEGDMPSRIANATREALEKVPSEVPLPPGACGYFWGAEADGTRFLFCARLNRSL